MTAKPLSILNVSASILGAHSTSRRVAGELIAAIAEKTPARVVTRDLAEGVSLIDGEWAGANQTPADQRSARQNAVLAYSESLIEEIEAADVIVIGAPVYNFSIPAGLKAWIDLVTRARRTFRYAENGPEGLIKGKRAVLVVASAGTPVGSPADFATPYLKFVLGFIGITDVEIVAADAHAIDADGAKARASEAVARVAARLAAEPVSAAA